MDRRLKAGVTKNGVRFTSCYLGLVRIANHFEQERLAS